MVIATAYASKAYAYASSSRQISRIKTIETQGGGTTFTPLTQPTVVQELDFLFQATQFVGIPGDGDARIYSNTATSTVDEETQANVTAYATFNDIGGSGAAASPSIWNSSLTRVPLEDNKGRTAYYHGHWKHIAWNPKLHPEVAHTKQFMLMHSVELNVPGTDTLDKDAFVYYDSHANFNMAGHSSVSLWFYPTDISALGGGFFRWLLQRYINSTTFFLIAIATTAGGDVGRVLCEVNDAGTLRKVMSVGTVNLNAWNLIIFTYNVSTDMLTIYLNNSAPTTTAYLAGTVNPWAGDSNMYIGGIPFSPNERFTGYLDNFVFWTDKALTNTEASNMWNHGTII